MKGEIAMARKPKITVFFGKGAGTGKETVAALDLVNCITQHCLGNAMIDAKKLPSYFGDNPGGYSSLFHNESTTFRWYWEKSKRIEVVIEYNENRRMIEMRMKFYEKEKKNPFIKFLVRFNSDGDVTTFFFVP